MEIVCLAGTASSTLREEEIIDWLEAETSLLDSLRNSVSIWKKVLMVEGG